LVLAAPARAERYALLAAVGQPEVGGAALSGPRHDVDALRQRLTRFNFAPQNIQTLVDEAATREAILDGVRQMVARAAAGDIVVFYFSGHGTSNFDGELGTELAAGTGALIPFDAAKKKPFAGTLIVGSRDLRGVLAKLHPEALGLIMLDACYSEDAAKSAGPPKAIRYWAPPERRPGWRRVEEVVRGAFAKAVDPYPYRNVLTLAASARYQPAFDIPPSEIRAGSYRTVDGRPHGAMSNALLAGLDGQADTNADGQLTYQELFHFVQQTVAAESPQHPQYQYPAEARGLLQQPVFRASTGGGWRSAGANTSGAAPVLVELVGANHELQAMVTSVPGVRQGMSRADYSLRAESHGGYSLNQAPKGIEVATFKGTAVDEIKTMLTAIAASRQLTDFRFPLSRGSVSLEADPADQGWYFDGQRFTLHGFSTDKGDALLVSVDATGVVSILHPVQGQHRLAAGQKVKLLGAKVSAPYGTSTLKLFVFDKAPEGLDRFYCTQTDQGTRCPEFSASSERFRDLLRVLNGHEGAGAEHQLKLETRP